MAGAVSYDITYFFNVFRRDDGEYTRSMWMTWQGADWERAMTRVGLINPGHRPIYAFTAKIKTLRDMRYA